MLSAFTFVGTLPVLCPNLNSLDPEQTELGAAPTFGSKTVLAHTQIECVLPALHYLFNPGSLSLGIH